MKMFTKAYLWTRKILLNFGIHPHLDHGDPKTEKHFNCTAPFLLTSQSDVAWDEARSLSYV